MKKLLRSKSIIQSNSPKTSSEKITVERIKSPSHRPSWFPDWKGETIILVGAGPSASSIPLNLAIEKAKFIAVNNSWKLCPWADVLYACDYRWWWRTRDWKEGFKGLKVSIDARACNEGDWNINRLLCAKTDDRIELKRLGTVGWGSNGGFNAFNFAAQLAPAKIILVGFDMNVTNGLHWHGPHPQGLGNPRDGQLERWRRSFDNAAQPVAQLGIEVINCSQTSSLQNYPKMSFEEALGI